MFAFHLNFVQFVFKCDTNASIQLFLEQLLLMAEIHFTKRPPILFQSDYVCFYCKEIGIRSLLEPSIFRYSIANCLAGVLQLFNHDMTIIQKVWNHNIFKIDTLQFLGSKKLN